MTNNRKCKITCLEKLNVDKFNLANSFCKSGTEIKIYSKGLIAECQNVWEFSNPYPEKKDNPVVVFSFVQKYDFCYTFYTINRTNCTYFG